MLQQLLNLAIQLLSYDFVYMNIQCKWEGLVVGGISTKSPPDLKIKMQFNL